MIKIIVFSVLIFCLKVSFAQGNDLILQIENIEGENGNIMIAVFDNEADFRTKENPIYKDSLIVNGSNLKSTFKSIPQGIYAIAIYHDENSDGKLNTAKLGIPTEGVGFSGKTKNLNKKPKFGDSVFELGSDTTIYINMIYKKKKDENKD